MKLYIVAIDDLELGPDIIAFEDSIDARWFVKHMADLIEQNVDCFLYQDTIVDTDSEYVIHIYTNYGYTSKIAMYEREILLKNKWAQIENVVTKLTARYKADEDLYRND